MAETILIALIDPSFEARLHTIFNMALLDLFLHFFDAFGCAKVAPLGHFLLKLCFISALFDPLDSVLAAFD